MTLTSYPYDAVAEPHAAAAPFCFAAPHAFRVLRAWRAWAARARDSATSGFILLRAADRSNGEDGTLLMSSEDLDAAALKAIGLYSHQRLVTRAAPEGTTSMLASRAAPEVRSTLRSLDDWAIEILLRTGAEVSRSLLVGLRHQEGRFELIVWPRVCAHEASSDICVLVDAMNPWIER